jgi:hypothetical protein
MNQRRGLCERIQLGVAREMSEDKDAAHLCIQATSQNHA